jgi:hypothetical protein
MAELAVNLNEQAKSQAVDFNQQPTEEICPICQCDLMPKEFNQLKFEEVVKLQQDLISKAKNK